VECAGAKGRHKKLLHRFGWEKKRKERGERGGVGVKEKDLQVIVVERSSGGGHTVDDFRGGSGPVERDIAEKEEYSKQTNVYIKIMIGGLYNAK